MACHCLCDERELGEKTTSGQHFFCKKSTCVILYLIGYFVREKSGEAGCSRFQKMWQEQFFTKCFIQKVLKFVRDIL